MFIGSVQATDTQPDVTRKKKGNLSYLPAYNHLLYLPYIVVTLQGKP